MRQTLAYALWNALQNSQLAKLNKDTELYSEWLGELWRLQDEFNGLTDVDLYILEDESDDTCIRANLFVTADEEPDDELEGLSPMDAAAVHAAKHYGAGDWYRLEIQPTFTASIVVGLEHTQGSDPEHDDAATVQLADVVIIALDSPYEYEETEVNYD
jgi:hypothetical protein